MQSTITKSPDRREIQDYRQETTFYLQHKLTREEFTKLRDDRGVVPVKLIPLRQRTDEPPQMFLRIYGVIPQNDGKVWFRGYISEVSSLAVSYPINGMAWPTDYDGNGSLMTKFQESASEEDNLPKVIVHW